MAVYYYVAETATGDRVSGTLSAADEAAARLELSAQPLNVLELHERPPAGETLTLGEDDLITLVETVGTAAANRVPLELTLAALAEDTDDKRLADVAGRLARQLERGESIEQAMVALEGRLPTEVRGLFRAAVASGDVTGTFAVFARQRLAAEKLRRRIRSVALYPLVILMLLLPLVAFLSYYVIPQYADLYSDFGLTLPIATRLLIGVSQQFPYYIGGVLLVFVGGPLLLRLASGRALVDRLRTTPPVFGPLWTWMGQREFAAALASFLKLRLPLPEAMAHTADVLGDRNLARACALVGEQLKQGQPLSATLAESIDFDRGLVSMVRWGEANAVMPEALGIAVEVFDDRIEQQVSLVQRLLPPVMLVGIGALMFFVVVSLYVPLVSLVQNLSGTH